MNRLFFTYIVTNNRNTVFYIGITDNIERRMDEHRNGLVDGFTKKYKCHKLVYLEQYQYVEHAIRREKQLKNWHRIWKVNLIKTMNPTFKDLSIDWEFFG